ncbi:MAG: ferrous iron transport protein A [Prochlorococcus sp.]
MTSGKMTLRDLEIDVVATVSEVLSDGSELGKGFKTRLEAMGLIQGRSVRVLRKAAAGGPYEVRVGSTTEIAIRRSEAELVRVSPA